MSTITEQFRDALFMGMLNAAAVLRDAKPGIGELEIANCIARECLDFWSDYSDHVVSLADAGDLTDYEIDTLLDDNRSVEDLFLSPEELQAREDEATFSYDNYMKHVSVPGGIAMIDRCEPTVYMAEADADADAALAFLEKVHTAPTPPSAPQRWQEIKKKLEARPGAPTTDWVETCSAKVTTLVERGFAVSADGTRTYLDEVGLKPGTVEEKLAIHEDGFDPNVKPRWWRTDDGELVGCYAPYIPLTNTTKPFAPLPKMRVWKDIGIEEPRVLADTDSLYATIRDTGFYCPDIPLTSCGPVVDPETFEPVTYDRWGYAMDNKAPTVDLKDTMDAAQFKAFGEAVMKGVAKTPPMPEFKIVKTKVEPKEFHLVPGVNITQETHDWLKALLPLECTKIDVEPPTRRFSNKWTTEVIQETTHGIDVEEEIMKALQEAIAEEEAAQDELSAAITAEIDGKIIAELKGDTSTVNAADSIFVTNKLDDSDSLYLTALKRRGFPIPKHLDPNLLNDLIGVQPMTGPTAQIHTLRVRYGLDSLAADQDVKAMLAPEGVEARTRRFTPRHWYTGEDSPKVEAARADHRHPEPVNIILTASNAPVHPLQCNNRTQREKSSIEVAAVSFR